MIQSKNKNNTFDEIDEVKVVDVFESDSQAVFKGEGENLKNYRIYGNTVDGASVGDRTENLFDGDFLQGYWAYADGVWAKTNTWIATKKIPCKSSTTYTFSFNQPSRWYGFVWFDFSGNYISTNNQQNSSSIQYHSYSTISPPNAAYMVINIAGYPDQSSTILPNDITDFMLVENSTPLPYEPYGYKVPVTISNGTDTLTTPIYLPEQIKKVGDEAEYIDYGEQKQHRVRKNLLQNTTTSRAINGVTFTVNDDGSVTCNTDENGATGNTNFFIPTNLSASTLYRLSGCPYNGDTSRYRIDVRNAASSDVIRDTNGNYIVEKGTGFTFSVNNDVYVNITIRIASGYVCNNITFYPMIRLASIEDDTYEPYIANTELDVTLPAIPTIAGTNTLSVNTNTKPSKVWGRLSDPRDILYVKDNLGNILFSKYHEIEGAPPLTYTAKNAGTLKNYRIYGNTVNSESVGDLVTEGDHAGEYCVPVTVEGKNLFDGIFLQGYWDGSDGSFVANYPTWICTNKSPCKPNTTYTLSFNSANSRWYGFVWYAENGDYLSPDTVQYPQTQCHCTATSPSNAAYMAIVIGGYPDFRAFISPSDVTDFMLVEGSTALPYEPYHAPVTTSIYLPEPIKMVGDEAEYIDYGEQKQHFVGGTSVDVTLPALPTIAGTNTLSVGTQVQPSKVYLKGKLKRTIYGWHVNPDISNSSNAVTYLEDAIGMTPASMGSTTFDYGSWKNAFFMPKPCMLKSNGKVDYYLDPNDYTKKLNGTASDISNPNYDGNAMM